MRDKKTSLLPLTLIAMLAAIFLSSSASAFVHPSGFETVGNVVNKYGTTAAQAIDGGVGECGGGSSAWAFASGFDGGADFWVETNASIRTTSVTIQSCSTGDKEFIVKNKDGGYNSVYSIGSAGPDTAGGGSVEGNFVQENGRIIIGVRNKRPDATHFLNDISLEFSYTRANTPPSKPEFALPPENQVLDSGTRIEWSESSDADNDSLAYNVNYSKPGSGGQNAIAVNAPCCSAEWNSSTLEEGEYNISVSAFDGIESSGVSTRRVGVKHVYYGQLEQKPAFGGKPVEWGARVNGSGRRNCAYSLPAGYFGLSITTGGRQVAFSNSSESVSWECNFTDGDNAIEFYTPAATVEEGRWSQDTRLQSSAEKQFLLKEITLENKFSLAYANVTLEVLCLNGFSCNSTAFSADIPAGGGVNASFRADGDGISESETVELGREYTKTIAIQNPLAELANITAEFALPEGLEFRMRVFNGSGYAAPPEGTSFSKEKTTGRVSFSSLREGETKIKFTAGRKENGGACYSNDECLSAECYGGVCVEPHGNGNENTTESNTENKVVSLESESLDGTNGNSSGTNESAKEENGGANGIEIRMEDSISTGWNDVVIYSGGKPANGTVKLYSPGGTAFELKIEGGRGRFLFDETGLWRISFAGKTKEVKVSKQQSSGGDKTAENAETSGNAGAVGNDKRTPGLLGAFFSVSALGVNATAAAAVLLMGACIMAFKLFRNKITVSRTFSKGRVKITVKNHWLDLKNVRITELVEEGSASNHSLEPTATETVTGVLLEWKFEALKKGGEIILVHDHAGGRPENPVELEAESGDGGKIYRKAGE